MSSLKSILDSNELQWPAHEPNPAVRELYVALERDYPEVAAELQDGVSRRRWLQLMGASLALGGVVGCRQPSQNIVPFVFRPENRVPGQPVRYATMYNFDGVAVPLLVNTIDGRPLKVDGNPEHPDSQGASDAFSQALILEMYDPDRSQTPSRLLNGRREESTWEKFEPEFTRLVTAAGASQGKGLAVLSERNSSPTLARLKKQLLSKYPEAKWYDYAPCGDDQIVAGTKLAFGQPLRPQYALEKCRVVLAIDADVMSGGGAAIKNAAALIAARNPEAEWMSRVYCVESQFSLVGGTADHRLALPPSRMASFVADLEEAVAAGTAPAAGGEEKSKFFAALVEDLLAQRGAAAVLCGPAQPPEIQAAVWRINQALGNLGSTISFIAVEDRATSVEQLAALSESARNGGVQTLIILEGNPAYDAPADLKFAELLGKIPTTVHLAVTANETSQSCSWFANVAHPLECWGDGLADNGSYCIAQPLIAPLYGALSTIEILARGLGEANRTGLELVQQTAADALKGDNSQVAWQETVHLGFVPTSAAAAVVPTLGAATPLTRGADWKAGWQNGELELVLLPSRQLHDGRFGNVGWLLELPDFITKQTWGNAAILSPHTARQMGLRQRQVVRLEVEGRQIELPVHMQPGHANGTVTVWLGFGRTHAGRVGGNVDKGVPLVGGNGYLLRDRQGLYARSKVTLVPTSRQEKMALTQDPFDLDTMGRIGIRRRLGEDSALIRSGTFADYRKFVGEHGNQASPARLDTEHTPDDARYQGGAAPGGHGANERRPAAGTALPVIQVSHRQDGAQASNGEAQLHDLEWPEGHHLHFANKSLNPGPKYSAEYKWGMAIDLSKCVGCNACVIACQAENNIPIVGKEEVWRGREMHWMRIDAYFVESADDPDGEHAEFKFQPVACMHCENAPCETVCPVAATLHSDEGLNDMVYNRCIGTRYCGNNCPYKVRRFNYLNYSEATTFIKYPNEGIYNHKEKEIRGLGMNPQVTVRSRGVMEKCTYCVQRIQNTKILARNERRPIGPNEITTACQDACPTEAIVFGNLADEHSDVRKNQLNVRAYQLLDYLNNLPRTRYLARVRNPHPALAPAPATEHHG